MSGGAGARRSGSRYRAASRIFLPLEQIGKPHMTLPGTPLRQLAFVESGLRDFTYGQFLNLNATSAAASFLSFAQ
jgi:hypothetical protein